MKKGFLILCIFLISCSGNPQKVILPDEEVELASGPIKEIEIPKEEPVIEGPSIEEQEQQKFKELADRKMLEAKDQIRELIKYIQENDVSNEAEVNLELSKDFLSQAEIEYDKKEYGNAVKYANDALNLAVTPE